MIDVEEQGAWTGKGDNRVQYRVRAEKQGVGSPTGFPCDHRHIPSCCHTLLIGGNILSPDGTQQCLKIGERKEGVGWENVYPYKIKKPGSSRSPEDEKEKN